MLDSPLRPFIERALKQTAVFIANQGVSANVLTTLGLCFGVIATFSVALGNFPLALICAGLSRLFDGLDGMVARQNGPTELGGYYDILADFTFYAILPVGFVFYDPTRNGVAGAVLLAGFFINATSFLGFAILAEKRALQTQANGKKSHFHSVGLIEGTETIVFFALCLVWPTLFAPLSFVLSGLIALTVCHRVYNARKIF